MTRTGVRTLAALWAALAAPRAAAQSDEVKELRRELQQMKSAMAAQREDYERRLGELETRLGEAAAAGREEEIANAVAEKVRLYTRPDPATLYPNRGIFDALEGGLFFTGLFRSRFEGRRDNVDFNPGDSGLDDSGFGFNGRFRLGFGAVLYKELADDDPRRGESPRNVQVSALTEFQSYGTFANNSYVNVTSPSGLSTPFAFNILTEPFEAVGLYQGYLYFQKLVDESLNVKVGRQELVFGNELILGNNSFYEGTVHDALLVQWDRERENGYRVSLAVAKEAAEDASIGTSIRSFDEDEFAVLYAEIFPSETLRFDLYALRFEARSGGNNDTFVTGSTAFIYDGALTPPILGRHFTLGGRALATELDLAGGPLAINVEAAYQTGVADAPGGGRRSIHGWTAEFIANWRIPPKDGGLKPIATLAYLYAGGGEPGAAGAIGFQPLYVNRHFEALEVNARERLEKVYYPGGGRYGNMDQIPLFNVHAFKAALSFEVAHRVEVGASYIFAATADDQGYGSGSFGHEVDLFGTYVYSNSLQFSANVGVFFPGRTARELSDALFFAGQLLSGADNEPSLSVYVQALLQF